MLGKLLFSVGRAQEPHLLAHFEEDFYGKQLKLVVTGYLRPEMNFDSLGM